MKMGTSKDTHLGYHPVYPVSLHNGGPIPDWMRFFWEPAREIGPMRCVYSTMDRRTPRIVFVRPKWQGTVIYALLALLGVPLVILLVMYLEGRGKPSFVDWSSAVPNSLLLGVICALAIIIFKLTQVPIGEACTYVGEAGLARANAGEITLKVTGTWVVKFADAASLYTSEIEVYGQRSSIIDHVSGTYRYTRLKYQWNDASGKCLFEIKGKYDKNNPQPWDPALRDFAYAAENVWFDYRTECVRQQIKTSGFASFHMSNGQRLEVSEQAVNIVSRKGEGRLVPAGELESIVVEEMSIKFVFRGESFFQRFAGAGDYRLCKAALEQLCRIDFGDREGLVRVWGE